MLAFLGFGITSLLFIAHAYTFQRYSSPKSKVNLDSFAYAYCALGLAFLFWAVASLLGSPTALKEAVIMGNGLILLGTIFMINIWLKDSNRLAVLSIASLTACALLWYRISNLTPAPYLSEGILFFNSQNSVQIVLAAIFAGIWLPTNIKVARLVTSGLHDELLTKMYTQIYMAATFSAVIFLAAQRVITLVISFSAIGVCLALLIRSNILITQLEKGAHGKRAK